jgi:hypothetical protein
MKFSLSAIAALLLATPLVAQVPNLLPHQGRVAVNGVNFDGAGQFKFALVNAAGTTSYWSNDSSSVAGSQPTAAVSLPVTKGLYSAMLGDTSLANMTAVPASVFANADLRLRVWFNNGTLGFQQLTPDQRLAPNGYLPDGAVTSGKLAPGAASPGVKVTGSTQAVVPNTNYIAANSGGTAFTLPATAVEGDVTTISATGLGGFTVFDSNAWIPRGPPQPWNEIVLSNDGTRLAAITTTSGVFTSTDSGMAWVPQPGSPSGLSIASSSDGLKLAAAAGGKLMTSTNGGQTWTESSASVAGSLDWHDVASSADGNRLAATVFDSSAGIGIVYTSTNAGGLWVRRNNTPAAPNALLNITSSADGLRLYAGRRQQSSQLYVSTDGGATWALSGPAIAWRALACSADGKYVGGADTTIRVSSDFGATWTQHAATADTLAVSANGQFWLAGSSTYQTLYSSENFGASWRLRGVPRDWFATAVSADGSKLFAGDYGGPIYTNGGEVAAGGGDGTVTLRYGPFGWVPLQQSGGWVKEGSHLTFYGGNVGIGATNPSFPLSLGPTYGNTKLALFDSGPVSYGMGVASNQFRLHLIDPSARFSFLDAPDGNELLTIKGDGKVGIGTANPATALQVNGVITGDGSGLTNVNAGSLTGSVPAASLTAIPAANLTGAVPAASLTSLPAASLTGSVPAAALTTVPAANLTGAVPAAALTSVPAASLTGAINPASLPSTIAYRNTANAFTGNQSITGNLAANGSVNFGPSSSAAGFASVAMGNNASAAGNYSYAFGQSAATTVTAGNSVALGSNATAAHSGSFLWSDATGNPRSTTAANQFVIHAAGGVTMNASGGFAQPQLLLTQSTAGEWSRLRLQSNGPAWDVALGPGAAPVMNFFNGTANVLSLEQDGDAWLQRNLNFGTGPLRQMLDLWNGEHGIGVQAWTTYFRTNGTAPGAFAWYKGGVHNDAQYNPGGGVELMRLDSGGLWVRNTFVSSSDRNRKENFQPVDAREVLEKVAALPVSRWNYKDDPDTPHIGPMAQDFHAAFGAGADDKHITMVDADGVALAAIQGLNEKLKDKDAEIARLREETAALREALSKQSATLEARLEALERRERKTESAKLSRK